MTRTKNAISGNGIIRELVEVDFSVFNHFNPEHDLLSMNNQVSVVLSTIKDDTNVNVQMQTIRLYFLVP